MFTIVPGKTHLKNDGAEPAALKRRVYPKHGRVVVPTARVEPLENGQAVKPLTPWFLRRNEVLIPVKANASRENVQ